MDANSIFNFYIISWWPWVADVTTEQPCLYISLQACSTFDASKETKVKSIYNSHLHNTDGGGHH